jgi:glycosyltransferase involved in cell wall biosynthesis
MGLPVHLALQAKRAETLCDLVWAGNENAGILLSLLRLRRPLVVVAHHMESPPKASLARWCKAVDRWSGIGYLSDEGKRFLSDAFHVPSERLFQYESAKYLRRTATAVHTRTGPIMSVGVAKRDYASLLAALHDLRGCDTEIYASSKFGNTFKRGFGTPPPEWVHAMGWVDDGKLFQRYQHARFVVVPLDPTSHTGAGINAVLEGSALGKAVIATHTGGMATFVKDGETGILVPPRNVQALRDAIRSLWAEPALAQRLGAAGQRYMRERFDPAVVDDNIVRFLDKLRKGETRR